MIIIVANILGNGAFALYVQTKYIIKNGSSYAVVKERGPFLTAYYNRQAAIAYANEWWDKYNPRFPAFQDDCTNYISQCLYAGGAPMYGFTNRAQGWWMIGTPESGALAGVLPIRCVGIWKRQQRA